MPVKQRFSDIDEHAAQMAGFDQHYVQLSPGPFQGVFSSLALPQGIGFDVEWVAQALHQQASVPPQTVSLVTFLDLQGRAIFNGCQLSSFDAFVVAPGTALDLRTPPGATIAVVTIPEPVLGGAPATRRLRADACATILRPLLMPLLQTLDSGPDVLGNSSIANSLAAELLETALHFLHADDAIDGTADTLSATRRRDVFRAAKEAIDQLDSADLSVPTICRLTGVSRRTLEYCFDDAVAMSPLQYLKIKRLNAIRRDLVGACGAGTTIGDVAARHGIWHLGRLASEYGRLFGELPSATLQRSRRRAGSASPN